MKQLLYCVLLAFVAITAKAQPCGDLFISEYVEGSSFNKAIEIYNPTLSALNLTGYQLQLFTNGAATASVTLNLSGTIAAGDVYVVVNGQASAAIKAVRDTTISNVTNFNGDDAVALLNGSTVIDVIGEIGVDPGSSWPIIIGTDTFATADYTLVRNTAVQEGSTVWTTGVTGWDVLPRDTIRLGAHSMTPCAPPVDTIVRFQPTAASVNEPAGTYNINITLNQAPAADKTVDVTLISGDAADVGNFGTTSVLIPANATSAVMVVSVTDDALAEASELFSFALRNPSSGLTLGADTLFTLTILDDDSIVPPAPLYPIGTVTTVDTDGLPDSVGVQCRVTGVVYGINLRNTGLQFTIHDGTGGMGVFSPTNTFGYTVQEGDSVVVSGEVGEFAGYAQMELLDTVYTVGTGTLNQPAVVTELDETTESELVRINRVWLVNQGDWDNSNPAGFTAEVTNGTETFELRIEEQVDLFNEPAPTSSFDVIGLGSQFDNTAPHNTGYQILPRSSDDIILHTGIGREVSEDFVLYPNPNRGVFTIRLNEPANKQTTVIISDLTGRALVAKTGAFESVFSMDVSTLSQGVYIVEIATPTSVKRQKVSIQ